MRTPRAKWGSRRQQVIDGIEAHGQHRPNLATLAAWLDIPLPTVQYWLDLLERQGWIVVRHRGRNRIDGSALEIELRDPDQPNL